MDGAEIRNRLLELYPALRSLPAKRLDELLDEAMVRTVPSGTVMFDERNACQAFPLLIEGTIRVSKTAQNGRELQLYRVVPGEACMLSSSCLLGNVPYSARGVAESDLVLVALPQPVFSRLRAEHEPCRTYVFSLFAERVSELMELVEAVAFQRLDRRLATLLLGKGRVIRTTHQSLAEELGSVREIVSRLLARSVDRTVGARPRAPIDIHNPPGLRHGAGTSCPESLVRRA